MDNVILRKDIVNRPSLVSEIFSSSNIINDSLLTPEIITNKFFYEIPKSTNGRSSDLICLSSSEDDLEHFIKKPIEHKGKEEIITNEIDILKSIFIENCKDGVNEYIIIGMIKSCNEYDMDDIKKCKPYKIIIMNNYIQIQKFNGDIIKSDFMKLELQDILSFELYQIKGQVYLTIASKNLNIPYISILKEDKSQFNLLFKTLIKFTPIFKDCNVIEILEKNKITHKLFYINQKISIILKISITYLRFSLINKWQKGILFTIPCLNRLWYSVSSCPNVIYSRDLRTALRLTVNTAATPDEEIDLNPIAKAPNSYLSKKWRRFSTNLKLNKLPNNNNNNDNNNILPNVGTRATTEQFSEREMPTILQNYIVCDFPLFLTTHNELSTSSASTSSASTSSASTSTTINESTSAKLVKQHFNTSSLYVTFGFDCRSTFSLGTKGNNNQNIVRKTAALATTTTTNNKADVNTGLLNEAAVALNLNLLERELDHWVSLFNYSIYDVGKELNRQRLCVPIGASENLNVEDFVISPPDSSCCRSTVLSDEIVIKKCAIPVVLEKLLNYITDYGLDSKGIYRLNGSQLKIETLTNELILNQVLLPSHHQNMSPSYSNSLKNDNFKGGGAGDYLDLPSYLINRDIFSEHDVANTLKRYLRNLPEPLVPSKCFERLKAVAFPGDHSTAIVFSSLSSTPNSTLPHFLHTKNNNNNPEIVDDSLLLDDSCTSKIKLATRIETKIPAYKEILYDTTLLPAINFSTLKRLIGHLFYIASHETKNNMSAQNLASILGPGIMAPRLAPDKSPEFEDYNDTNGYIIVLSDLISHCCDIFNVSPKDFEKEDKVREGILKLSLAKSQASSRAGEFLIPVHLSRDLLLPPSEMNDEYHGNPSLYAFEDLIESHFESSQLENRYKCISVRVNAKMTAGDLLKEIRCLVVNNITTETGNHFCLDKRCDNNMENGFQVSLKSVTAMIDDDDNDDTGEVIDPPGEEAANGDLVVTGGEIDQQRYDLTFKTRLNTLLSSRDPGTKSFVGLLKKPTAQAGNYASKSGKNPPFTLVHPPPTPIHSTCLIEILLNGNLVRPVPTPESMISVVLQWTIYYEFFEHFKFDSREFQELCLSISCFPNLKKRSMNANKKASKVSSPSISSPKFVYGKERNTKDKRSPPPSSGHQDFVDRVPSSLCSIDDSFSSQSCHSLIDIPTMTPPPPPVNQNKFAYTSNGQLSSANENEPPTNASSYDLIRLNVMSFDPFLTADKSYPILPFSLCAEFSITVFTCPINSKCDFTPPDPAVAAQCNKVSPLTSKDTQPSSLNHHTSVNTHLPITSTSSTSRHKRYIVEFSRKTLTYYSKKRSKSTDPVQTLELNTVHLYRGLPFLNKNCFHRTSNTSSPTDLNTTTKDQRLQIPANVSTQTYGFTIFFETSDSGTTSNKALKCRLLTCHAIICNTKEEFDLWCHALFKSKYYSD